MSRVLSQSEIDNMLKNLLPDSSVLPEEGSESDSSSPAFSDSGASMPFSGFSFPTPAPIPAADSEAIPAGIAAFKARIAAMQAQREDNPAE